MTWIRKYNILFLEIGSKNIFFEECLFGKENSFWEWTFGKERLSWEWSSGGKRSSEPIQSHSL